jgi:transcription elongation factor GreA
LPDKHETMTLGEAVEIYVGGLKKEDRLISQTEVRKFVQWCGSNRVPKSLNPPEIARYGENLSSADAGYTQRVNSLKLFLQFLKKSGMVGQSLVSHLKVRKLKRRGVLQHAPRRTEKITLTAAGYASIEKEIVVLKVKREDVIGQVSRAAADKDFRENAPLHAAKEEYGKIEGRLNELEETLKRAVISAECEVEADKVGVGSKIRLNDLSCGEVLVYTIVNPRESNPLKGRISGESPVGKAVMGCSLGEEITVETPAGAARYKIAAVKNKSA